MFGLCVFLLLSALVLSHGLTFQDFPVRPITVSY